MDITKIVGIGIIGVILTVTVKNHRPELGICTALATGIIIFSFTLPYLNSVIEDISSLFDDSKINPSYLKAIIKSDKERFR